MRFTFKFVYAWYVCSSLVAWAQPSQSFPIGSPQNCLRLPNHVAIQDCQVQQKAQGLEWERQLKERYAPPTTRLNSLEAKSFMNCFKRKSTGEQICAN
jgi:hypothetical protein